MTTHMHEGMSLAEFARESGSPYEKLYHQHITKAGRGRRQDGRSKHPLKQTHHSMLRRCYYPKAFAYHCYGGRGITVCDRWREPDAGFWNFVADMGDRPEGYTLDRIDVNGNYEPSNCRWADWATQAANKRTRGVKAA